MSREHWVGYDASDEVLVRAGRIHVPFGLRNIEHTSFVRGATRTDLNQDQQHGATIAYGAGKLRAEAMLIAGNFQIAQDRFRERGVAAYIEHACGQRLTLGANALAARAAADVLAPGAGWTYRTAYGLFSRYAPHSKVAILAEVDALVTTTSRVDPQVGYVSFIQADYEPVRGLHAIGTFETRARPQRDGGHDVGGWLGAAWFPAPHFEVRGDGIVRWFDGKPVQTILFQGQVYL